MKKKARTEKSALKDWELRLYIVGKNEKNQRAIRNIDEIFNEYFSDNYSMEVVDLLNAPWRAQEDEVIATPTLLCLRPKPIKKIIGDLSSKEKVLRALHIDVGLD